MAGHEITPAGEYSTRDFQLLFQQTNAASWDQAIDWLRSDGTQQLAAGHAEQMKFDLQLLRDQQAHFVRDPLRVYELARQAHIA